jgi:chromate transporter
LAECERVTTGALYLLLLKATVLSFSGFGSLPQIREDLVVRHGILTDEQLNRSVLVARTTPGPMGTYLVAIGYAVGGTRGAVAGWLAMATPAFLVIPLLFVIESFSRHPRVIGGLSSLILASAVLLVLSCIPLSSDLAAGIRAFR